MVTFTVGSFKLKPDRVPDNGPRDLDTSMSFNIKDVILLADGARDYIDRGLPSEEDPWGVELVPPPAPHSELSFGEDKENIPPMAGIYQEI